MALESLERGQSTTLLFSQEIAFDAFVRAQRAALLRFLRLRTSSEEDARDIAQDSLIRLRRYRERAPESWSSLLYRMAISALNDRMRLAGTRQGARHVGLVGGPADRPSADPMHVQRAAARQELAALQHVLLSLPGRCRQIYLLNRIEGMSRGEVASHCGISVTAVEKNIGKALRLVRERMLSFNQKTDKT